MALPCEFESRHPHTKNHKQSRKRLCFQSQVDAATLNLWLFNKTVDANFSVA
ncbi:hypothetical protein [Limnoraphis robusta]|uniref:Transposase n=1 Tax=Limnoraphis robusta CCNP1315 TaxID=3110306 RepID=A0ABU5TUV0_9CYAN|nr:hypothetical protein [Limnoraphis robusta]MEA5518675.1 hypothetical protein [Limnoraphis robusta CCNP1315]MEA5545004.1 hypothetical protein [Limnoraphis robusta CCNP1324]